VRVFSQAFAAAGMHDVEELDRKQYGATVGNGRPADYGGQWDIAKRRKRKLAEEVEQAY